MNHSEVRFFIYNWSIYRINALKKHSYENICTGNVILFDLKSSRLSLSGQRNDLIERGINSAVTKSYKNVSNFNQTATF